MIAHAADGSMRDALSLTDQAIALGNGNVETDTVTHMLGTLDTDQAIHLLEAISDAAATSGDGLHPRPCREWRGMGWVVESTCDPITSFGYVPSTAINLR